MAESMDEKGLKDPLQIVETPIDSGVCLDRLYDAMLWKSYIFVDGKKVEDRVYEERTQILKEEKCRILDLRTEVFQYHFVVGRTLLKVITNRFSIIENSRTSLSRRRRECKALPLRI